MRDGVDGDEGKRGAGRGFLDREEDGDAGELAFAIEERFGVRGAGGLIMGRPGGEAQGIEIGFDPCHIPQEGYLVSRNLHFHD